MGRAYPGTVRMLVRRRAGFVAAVSLAILLSACGRSVGVDPLPIDGPQTRSACAALVAALPQQISAGRIWRVEPDPSSASAWGSPAVVLRCGSSVPQPQPTDQLLTVDDLDWLVTTLSGGEEYTTTGRAPGVIVTVPADYRPTAQVLAELSPIVAAHTSPATPAPAP